MTAALARRDEGCASDLLMDRWLLGEIPGSDEARRLEQHVRTCAACEARLLALRSLYGARPTARPAHVERPRLVTVPKDGPAAQSGVLQVVILRDGLLVGTEVFTPGRYEIGSDAICALKLDGVEGSHAVLHLRGGRVAIEAKRGPVFVNGYRIECCELRPIDEVCVGSYVLRTRVIAREGEVTEVTQIPAPEPKSAPAPIALKLELYWGDALQSAAVFENVPTPGQLERFGFMGAEAIDGGFELDGRYQVRHGDSLRIPRGPLTLVATAVPVQPRVARTSVREWPWFVISLASILSISVVLFGWLAPVPDTDPLFVPKEFKAEAHFIVPPKAPKAPPVNVEDPSQHVPPRVRHAPPAHPCKGCGLSRLPDLKLKPLDNVFASLDKIGKTPGKSGKHVAGLGALAGLGLPSAGTAFKFGADTTGGIGIGSAGKMGKGNIGSGSPQGTVAEGGVPHFTDKNKGWIDRDAVAKVVAAHTGEISTCYERSMLKNGAFAGKMLVEWTIDEAGRVHSSRVKSSDVKNADFGVCVLAHLDQWKFPPAHGHVVVTYPFHLNSVGY